LKSLASSEPSLTFTDVTAFFASFDSMTAPFFSCLLPTLFTGMLTAA
jgi:hypothetical protein